MEKQLNEVLTSSTPIKVWIDDFINSNNPIFAGKSKEERRQMAIAAYYSKKKESKKKK